MRTLGAGLAVGLIGCGGSDPCAMDRSVTSIDGAVELAGDLPDPTLACFLTALARPLGVELTSNAFSLQPAIGLRTPRVLISDGGLVMSVVPEGEASPLLELGELQDDGRSLKAEIAFPLTGPLTRADAFERTLDFEGAGASSCGVCHHDEIEVAPLEFASLPLRPAPSTIVPLTLLREEHESCTIVDPADVGRCAMLAALFDHGPVEHVPLPESYPF